MLTFYNKKFLFLKTKKTASTSLEVELSRFAGDADILTPLVPADESFRRKVSGKSMQNYRYVALPSGVTKHGFFSKLNRRFNYKFYNHIPYAETVSKAPELMGAKVITIIREPIKQAVSNVKWIAHARGASLQEAKKIFLSGSFVGNSEIIRGLPRDALVLFFEEPENWESKIKEYLSCPELNLNISHRKKSSSESVIFTDSEIKFINGRERDIASLYETV